MFGDWNVRPSMREISFELPRSDEDRPFADASLRKSSKWIQGRTEVCTLWNDRVLYGAEMNELMFRPTPPCKRASRSSCKPLVVVFDMILYIGADRKVRGEFFSDVFETMILRTRK